MKQRPRCSGSARWEQGQFETPLPLSFVLPCRTKSDLGYVVAAQVRVRFYDIAHRTLHSPYTRRRSRGKFGGADCCSLHLRQVDIRDNLTRRNTAPDLTMFSVQHIRVVPRARRLACRCVPSVRQIVSLPSQRPQQVNSQNVWVLGAGTLRAYP